MEDLSKRFRSAYLYSPQVDETFPGYDFEGIIKCRPLTEGMHESKGELVKRLPSYVQAIDEVIRVHGDEALYLTYLPGAYIGIIAAHRLTNAGVDVFFRVTNDIAEETVERHGTRTRAMLAAVVGPPFNHFTRYLVGERPAFFSGERFLGDKANYYEIESRSLREKDILEEPPAQPRGNSVAYVGRFDPAKGVSTLLEAISKSELTQTANIVGYGSREQEDYLRGRAEKLGIMDRVIFHGYVPFGSALFGILRESDILVVPSLAEYQGKTHMEGMAAGCCVIASDVGGITQFVKHKQNGVLVEPGDPDDLAYWIDELLADDELRRRLSTEGLDASSDRTVEPMNDFIIKKLQEHEYISIEDSPQS